MEGELMMKESRGDEDYAKRWTKYPTRKKSKKLEGNKIRCVTRDALCINQKKILKKMCISKKRKVGKKSKVERKRDKNLERKNNSMVC